MDTRQIFTSFLNKFLEMPLWVKEILYIELKKNLEENSLNLDMSGNINKDNLYQTYVPTLTYVGKKELESRSEGHPENVYRFLEYANSGSNVLQIILNNFWTLEETALYNVICLEKQYVIPPASIEAKTMLVYLSGRIRFGEYFKRIGKIDVDQLEAALRKQKELKSEGKNVGIATIMMELGSITEADSKIVLHLKEECKKRFILDADMFEKLECERQAQGSQAPAAESTIPVTSEGADPAVVSKLTKENKYLKSKLQAIYKILVGNK